MQNHYLLPTEKMGEPKKDKGRTHVIFQFTIIEERANDKKDNIRYCMAQGITWWPCHQIVPTLFHTLE